MKQLKDKVKEIRKREGLSQEEMGKRVGYTNRASINKIENGNGDVPFDKLIDLINEYLLDLSDLTNKDLVEYSLRDLKLDDWKELLVVYKDVMSVPFFNSDNCHGDIFYYSTEERMKKAIGFWMDSTSKGYFVRKAIIDNSNNRAIGTIEYFVRQNEPNYNDAILLRVDVHHYYEQKKALIKIFKIATNEAYSAFGRMPLITKGWDYAVERKEALSCLGFKECKEPLIGHENESFQHYWLAPNKDM